MNTSTGQKFKIGIFVLVGILLLVAGIFVIGSKKNLFSSTFKIYGVFKNTGGLMAGNNVQFGGVNVGTVSSIRIVSDTVVRVDMIIKDSKHEFIRTDATASVGSDGLMGDKLITISPGTANAPVIEKNGQIPTVEPMDLTAIMDKFTNVATNAEVITGVLASMALEIKNGNGSISRLLYNDKLALGLEATVDNAQSITRHLDGVSVTLGKVSNRMDLIAGDVNDITNEVKSGRGSLGSLIYKDDLAKELNTTVTSANYTLSTVQDAAYNFSENMKALQGGIFFRNYFKKKARAQEEQHQEFEDAQHKMSDAELETLRADINAELEKRKNAVAEPPKPIPQN